MTGLTAVYVRISEDRAGGLIGVVNQQEVCVELCNTNGWTYEVYVDNDISATLGKPRDAYNRLMGDVRAGVVKRIVVFHLSRLWRNRRERAEGIEILRHARGSVICARGPHIDMSTAYGRGMAAMLGEVDTMEVEIKSERQQLANAALLRAGLPHPGGPRAFGYEPGGMKVRESERAWVEGAFQRWVSGSTLGDIARWLNQQQVKTIYGREWSTGSLRRMLSNPRYAALRGTRPLLYDDDGHPLLGTNGQHRRSDWYEVVQPGKWPAIVDVKTWESAVARLRHPSRRSGRSHIGRKHLLAGIAVCAVCGSVLKTKTNNQQRSVSCPTKHHATRKAVPIERYVKLLILERLRRPDALDLVRARTPGVDVEALREEDAAIRSRLREISKDEVLGRRSRDEVLAARAAAAERLDEIAAQLADAGRGDIVAYFLTAGEPGEVWDRPDTPLSMKQALIEALAVVEVGSGRNGRPAKYTEHEPPPNVFVRWRQSSDDAQVEPVV